MPVRLLWGDRDCTPTEQEHDRNLMPGAQLMTLVHGGHFMPLDRPEAVIEHVEAQVKA